MRWHTAGGLHCLIVDGFGSLGMVYPEDHFWVGEFWYRKSCCWVKVANGEAEEEAKLAVAAAILREYIL
jgi:hypothetical protein